MTSLEGIVLSWLHYLLPVRGRGTYLADTEYLQPEVQYTLVPCLLRHWILKHTKVQQLPRPVCEVRVKVYWEKLRE